MLQLIQRTLEELPRQFRSDEYNREREKISAGLKLAQEMEFSRLQEQVTQSNFVLARTASGTAVVPAVGGRPMNPDEFEQLPADQREKIQARQNQLAEEVEKAFLRVRKLENQTREQLIALGGRTALFLLTPLFDELSGRYSGQQNVLDFLESAKRDMTGLFQHYSPEAEEGAPEESQGPSLKDVLENRYQVNLLVDNSGARGAPVVVETYPSYPNLLGRIEHEFVMGASRTHYTLIRAGALHRANGGYLIIPARDLFISPLAWDGLKRALRDGAIRIVDLVTQPGIGSTASLDPEPVPLDVKIIIIGTPLHYELLRSGDEDFAKLFKVRAEFATVMERTPQTEREYGLFIKSVVINNHLPAFDAQAVARVIEFSARLAERQARLSTRFGHIADLICEAAFWAGQEKRSVVSRADVQRAIDESVYRSNLYEERLQELIDDDTLLIATDGAVVGQVNALSVLGLGDYSFGRPTRLTASAYPGQGGIIDIERQANMGGAIHTKGVLILSGFLGNRFARSIPLSLTASLTFEQSYENVDGDSASAAELLALLSAISQIPLRQDRAITGSVNQHGQIQAIGGVNEKVEGFFRVCQRRGLTGEQGVVIPQANVRDLMLRDEITQAVSAGQFHLWPVRTIDEALRLFSDLEPGKISRDGTFPSGSFNHAVQARLEQLAHLKTSAEDIT